MSAWIRGLSPAPAPGELVLVAETGTGRMLRVLGAPHGRVPAMAPEHQGWLRVRVPKLAREATWQEHARELLVRAVAGEDLPWRSAPLPEDASVVILRLPVNSWVRTSLPFAYEIARRVGRGWRWCGRVQVLGRSDDDLVEWLLVSVPVLVAEAPRQDRRSQSLARGLALLSWFATLSPGTEIRPRDLVARFGYSPAGAGMAFRTRWFAFRRAARGVYVFEGRTQLTPRKRAVRDALEQS